MSIMWNLTDREYDVLKLLAEGNSNPQIAKKLCVTTHTVKAHIAAMYQKTGLHSRVLLAVRALRAGVLKAETLDV